MAEAARTKEEVLKDFRTHEILDAARRVIGALGYADASMERIAQEAGVAKGTLYLYFPSKEHLLERAIDHGLGRLLQATRSAVAGSEGAVGRLRAAVRTGVAHARENRAFFQAVVDAGGRRRDDGAFQIYVDLLAELLEDGVRSEALRAVDSARAARMVVHGMSGLVAESLLHGRPFPDDEDVDQMLDLFLHGLAL